MHALRMGQVGVGGVGFAMAPTKAHAGLSTRTSHPPPNCPLLCPHHSALEARWA